MKDKLLETISENSSFGIDEISRAYAIFKSYDLLVSACEFSEKTGYANLETACILVKKQYIHGLLEADTADAEDKIPKNPFKFSVAIKRKP